MRHVYLTVEDINNTIPEANIELHSDTYMALYENGDIEIVGSLVHSVDVDAWFNEYFEDAWNSSGDDQRGG